DEVERSIRLIGWNRPNLLELRDSDHWPSPHTDLRATVLDHLLAQGEDPAGWRVTLVTSLRVLGYVFNPASFYLCRDTAGALRVVIVEVNNTHGERHLYTLRPDAGGGTFRSAMSKAFYVSPFLDMDGEYAVSVRDEPERLTIVINEGQGGRPLLATSLVLRRRRLTNRSVVRMLLRHPLTTQRTIGLIHWHALNLWLRRVPFLRHGRQPAQPAQHGASLSR
ncbi:MAG: DUF1365 domain-containing protein, partial [Candidatus Limnocylindrales bacterium]